MRWFFPIILFVLAAFSVSAEETGKELLELSATACETVLPGESKSGARIRAADKAAFLSIKKLDNLTPVAQILNDHDLNIMVYRLVDEYVEDMSVHIIQSSDDKVCVDIRGWLNPAAIAGVSEAFAADKAMTQETDGDIMEQIARETDSEIAIRPDNLQELALVYIADFEFYDGSQSAKLSDILKNMYADNPYFYLTEDSEIADYVISPKVLKAKVETTDSEHKRLHMVVVLETKNLAEKFSDEYQNRFVLFDDNEDAQNIAFRMLTKLSEQAGENLLKKIEQNEQRKLEQKKLGRDLAS